MKRRPLLVILTFVFCSLIGYTQELQRPRILGISHVAVLVHNVDSSLAFYCNFLGYQEQYRLNKPNGDPSTIFVKVNDLQCVELFPEREAGTDRLYQIALIIDNAEAMRAYLDSCGLKVPAKVGKGRIGNYNFTTKDPDGHIVEFVQYEPDGWTMLDSGKHLRDERIGGHIKHIGFAVDSLSRSLKFYRDILGFQETWRGSKDGKMLSWVNMRVPDGTDYVEFMLYKDPPTLARLGSMNHFSLEVPDVSMAKEMLESRPARKAYPNKLETQIGINRKRQCNIFDPDGTRVELMESHTVDGILSPSSTALPPK
ncbi:MAG: VOC family protein [Bacteroidota bacterium]